MNTRSSIWIFVLATVVGLLGSSHMYAAKTWFVKLDAQGNGSSWEQAMGNPQQALRLAQAGDVIWVAAGTYLPTAGSSREKSFEIKQSVQMLGGFNGTETETNQRNPLRYTTILSGNIGQYDADDNVYHVVTIKHVRGSVLIDGFTIEGGNATGQESDQRVGGGIYLQQHKQNNAIVDLQNLIFRGNLAKDGGAVYAENSTENLSLNLSSCALMENEALLDGGAICLKTAKHATLRATLLNCELHANRGNYGGAIFNHAYSGKVLLEMEACRFSENLAYAHGPEVYWLKP
jgi:predicted outer membrane repeat protein